MHFLAFLNVPYAPRCRIVSVRARGMKSVDLNSTIARLCKRVSTKADRDFKGEREDRQSVWTQSVQSKGWGGMEEVIY